MKEQVLEVLRFNETASSLPNALLAIRNDADSVPEQFRGANSERSYEILKDKFNEFIASLIDINVNHLGSVNHSCYNSIPLPSLVVYFVNNFLCCYFPTTIGTTITSSRPFATLAFF
ncbi:hypothetical protein ACIQZM_09755 [Peribacillus sp. NPDC097206]|uniref:hypothetical protein n=1 Tax=Peribacillus sp. NPDC097206 TaxID=3364398 RepID=UPI00381F305B